MGHLLGVGRAADVRADPVPALSRRHRPVAHGRRSVAGGARRRDPDAGRRIDLPIIKFSVEWWNTLHQGTSVFRLGGSKIYPTILIPLFIMAAAFTLLFFTLLFAAARNEILRRRVRTLQLMQASK